MLSFRLGLMVLMLCSIAATAQEKTLKFVLYYPQVPPYMFQHAQSKQVIGLIPDLLQPFFLAQQLKVEFILDNRRGAEHRLYSGDVDAMLMAPQWAAHPNQLIFSDAVLQHQDFLFALHPFATGSQPKQWLAGKKVCTRQYYVYDALEPFFRQAATERVDASSEMAQLRMLTNGRCDFAYLNEHVAKWLLLHHFNQFVLHQSPSGFDPVGLTIALHPKWQRYLPALNQFLRQQQNQGVIRSKLQFYTEKKAEPAGSAF